MVTVASVLLVGFVAVVSMERLVCATMLTLTVDMAQVYVIA